MNTTVSRFTLALVLAAFAAGCFNLERKSTITAPTDPQSLAALLGNWTSSSVLPSADSCTDFSWQVTEQTGNSASGTFQGTCPGGLALTGTAQGTLLGSTVTWTASGNATAPGLPTCAFTLSGTALLEGSTIRVPYSGQTCLGPVQGEEVFTKD
jgi:hypothetical protein